MKTPKVSICIPTYKYAHYLPEAIESVLSQDFTDFELLIIDDDSPDHSREVIEGYARQDSRIVWSVNDRNIGMVANWNLCLIRAQGEYVRFLFGDDYFVSSVSLRRMVEALDRHPEVVMTGSARVVIDGSSRPLRVVSRFPDQSRHRGTAVVRRSLLEERNIVGEPSAVMFRRRMALRGFDPAYRQLVDLEMWFHLLGKGWYYHLGIPLTAFREHADQQSVHNERAGVLFEELVRINADYGCRPEIVNPFWRWLLACQATYRARQRAGSDQSAASDEEGRTFESHSIPIVGRFSLTLYRGIKPLVKLWRLISAGGKRCLWRSP